jgi:hypothetical protein
MPKVWENWGGIDEVWLEGILYTIVVLFMIAIFDFILPYVPFYGGLYDFSKTVFLNLEGVYYIFPLLSFVLIFIGLYIYPFGQSADSYPFNAYVGRLYKTVFILIISFTSLFLLIVISGFYHAGPANVSVEKTAIAQYMVIFGIFSLWILVILSSIIISPVINYLWENHLKAFEK